MHAAEHRDRELRHLRQALQSSASAVLITGRLVDRRKDGTTYTAEEAERERVHRIEAEALERRAAIERDRSLLVQTISHELPTPLTIVLGVAETLTGRDVAPAERAALLVPLLDNGFTYSPVGTPVRIGVDSRDGDLRITVIDEGPGIPAGVLERLDQLFQQADQGSTRVHGGFGLGLYAARRVAERLGGTVGFDRANGGTEVEVRLPDDRELAG